MYVGPPSQSVNKSISSTKDWESFFHYLTIKNVSNGEGTR